GLLHRRGRTRAAIIGEERPLALAKLQRRDEHRLGTAARDAFRRTAEQAGGEALVEAAAADDDQVRRARALDDLVGHDAHAERGVGAYAALRGLFGKRLEQRFAALLQHAAHLRGEIEIGFEAE